MTGATTALRIAVHDYAGHPFQFELSRTLAARGHVVRHFFFGDDPGPKGSDRASPDDPAGFSVEAVRIDWRYSKDRFVRRYVGDRLYARAAARRVAAFRPDVVISGNTPLDAQAALSRVAARVGARFVFWVQDFYSLAIRSVLAGRWHGLGDLVCRHYADLERRTLERSHAVVLISPDFRSYLPSPLREEERVHVIRNWGALRSITPKGRGGNAWAARHGIGNRFVFMYSGTLGLKHDPSLLLALCDAFADDDEVAVVVVSAGVNADALRAANEARPRANLMLLPLQPIEEFSDVLGSADVLVSMLEDGAAEFSVPSKLLSYLCAGRPILLSAPSRNLASRVLAESGGGLAPAAADRDAFIASARRLRADAPLRARLGRSGREFAERNFDIAVIARRFEDAFAS